MKKKFFNFINKGKLCKVLVGTLATVAISTTIITPIVIVYNNNINKGFKNKPTTTYDEVQQLQTDALTKLSKKIYWLDHKEGNDNLAHDDIVKQTSAFLYNINQSVQEYKMSQNLANNSDQLLDVQYAAIMKEANNVGIDISDLSVFNKSKDGVANNYYNMLIQQGVSIDEATQSTNKFKTIYQDEVNKAKIELWDPFEFAYQLDNSIVQQNLTLNQIKRKNNTSTTVDFRKETALSFIQGRLQSLLIPILEKSSFINLIKNYSSTGKYDVGNEIEANDLGKLFNFSYDRTEGAILSRVNLNDVNIDVNNLQAGKDGNYNPNINQFEIKPLSTYSSYAATYGLAEVIPGYQLHTKIIGKDVWSDSRKCHLDLQFGISAAASDQDHTVLWAPIDENKKNISQIDLNVDQLSQIQYISQHEYYTEENVNVKSGSYNSKQDRYYDVTTPDTRLSLAKLMNKYCRKDRNDDYIISKDSPMFINPADCAGIDTPNIPSIPVDKQGKFHANQELQLMATDVNTNAESAGVHSFSIQAHWVVTDQLEGKTVIVKDFGWNDNESIKKDIWINFYVDPNTAKNINYATQITQSMEYLKLFDTLAQLDKNGGTKEMKNAISQREGFLVATSVVNGALSVLVGLDTFLSGVSGGAFAVQLALSVAALAGTTVAAVFDGIDLDKLKAYEKQWEEICNKYYLVADAYKNIGGTILEQYDTLWDPHKDLEIKEAAANLVNNTIASYTTNFNQFMAEVLAILSSDSDKDTDSLFQKFNNYFQSFGASGFAVHGYSILLGGSVFTYCFWSTTGCTMPRSVQLFNSNPFAEEAIAAAEEANIRGTPLKNFAKWIKGSRPTVPGGGLNNYDELAVADVDAVGAQPSHAYILPACITFGTAASVLLGVIGASVTATIKNDDWNATDSAKYAIKADKNAFATDEHNKTILGDQITLNVVQVDNQQPITTGVVWGIENLTECNDYIVLVNNKLQIRQLAPTDKDITVKVRGLYTDSQDKKNYLLEWTISIPKI